MRRDKRSASLCSALAFALLALAQTGCGLPPQTATLEQFETCGQVEDYVKKQAQQQVDRIYLYTDRNALQKIYPRYATFRNFGSVALAGGSAGFGFGAAMAAPTASKSNTNTSGSPGTPAPSAPSRLFSQTNVQVEGVDEADRLKNDDRYIYALIQDYLVIYDAWPPEKTKVLSRTKLSQWGREMFVYRDLVLIFTTTYEQLQSRFERAWGMTSGWWGDRWAVRAPTSMTAPPTTQITILDIKDKTKPVFLRQLTLPGVYMSSRRLRSLVHIVTYKNHQNSNDSGLLPNDIGQTQQDQSGRASLHGDSAALKAHKRYTTRIQQAKLSDLVVNYTDSTYKNGALQNQQAPQLNCAQIYKPKVSSGSGIVYIYSLDLEQPLQHVQNTTLVSDAENIYASPYALYVASTPLASVNSYAQLSTHIHKFDISRPEARVTYRASGSIPGQLVNQFSMDEHNRALRVATTTIDLKPNTKDEGKFYNNHVFVLQEQDAKLQKIGELRDLAPGEKLFAVRFLGDRGFLVTFPDQPARASAGGVISTIIPWWGMDPLFTLDLKDPKHPKRIGELKIPGFSTYIHPLGPNHLLTIGFDGNENQLNGNAQVAIFDITNFADPKQTHKQTIPSSVPGELEELLYAHKAFNYFAPQKMLALPVNQEMQLIPVDPISGLGQRVTISHKDLRTSNKQLLGRLDQVDTGHGWRSAFIDNVIYSVSPHGIDIRRITDPKTSLASFRVD